MMAANHFVCLTSAPPSAAISMQTSNDSLNQKSSHSQPNHQSDAADSNVLNDRLVYRQQLKKSLVWMGGLLVCGVASAAAVVWLLLPF